MRLTQAGFALGAGIFNTFEIVPSGLSVNEGETFSVEVRTTGISDGTTLFWTINNITTTSADFVASSGSFTITAGVGTFNINLSADALTEGPESFSISVRRGSTSGIVVATSAAIGINDTSMTPSYAITPDITSVNEGQSVLFTVDTVNVPSGTVLYWTTQSVTGTVATSDFTDNLTSGTITINNNTASITRTLSNDNTTEGAESFAIQIRTGSGSGPVVVTSSTVTINDTSVPTYLVTPDIGSVNEGGTVTFTVSTQGVSNGTTLFWTTSTISGTINASDFSDSATVGSFTINSNTGSFTRTLRSDITTEGAESFAIQIRTGSTSGTIVATSSAITINDTSLDPTYAVTPSVTTVTESGSVTFTVTTTNVANGTTLFWTTQTVSGTVNANDFADIAASGSVVINNNTASIVRTMRGDLFTEGAESFQLQIRTGSTSGTIVASSSVVNINDTSLNDPNQPVGQVMFSGATSASWNSWELFEWTVPTGVTSISFVMVGAGGSCAGFSAPWGVGGGGGGGGLLYRNDYPVTPGQIFKILVARPSRGEAGRATEIYAEDGVTLLFRAGGGGQGTFRTTGTNSFAAGGLGGSSFFGVDAVTNFGGNGGDGFIGSNTSGTTNTLGGGGGAAGYSGSGGRGSGSNSATAGSGGGGGGGGRKITRQGSISQLSNTGQFSGDGGAVAPFGQGSNGAAGVDSGSTQSGNAGDGQPRDANSRFGFGAKYGNGGSSTTTFPAQGGPGVVRIIWPGARRQFPNTNTGDLSSLP